MEWSWPESVSSNRQRVVEELVQGRELACQLRRVLDHKSSVPVMNGGDVIGSAEGLVNKIMGSLANTLLILNGKDQSSENHLEIISYNQFQFSTSSTFNTSIMSTTGCVDSSSEDSKESRKTTSTFKDSRGSYKRRKSSQYSWSRDSTTWTDDTHGWRKYGQKIILNEKHRRNYYRCTNKFDQGCQATKYVQKTQDDPPVFRTTYYGNHSCRDSLKASDELVVDYCTSPRESSKFISFGNGHATNKQEHPFFNSFTSFKNELIIEDEIIPAASLDHHVTTHHDHHSSDHYLASDDLTAFEFSGPMTGFSSTIGQLLDHEDVISAMIEEYSHVL